MGELPNRVALSAAAIRSTRNLAPVARTHAELRGLDRSAQPFHMIYDLRGSFSRKQNVEFFSAAAEGLSASGHPCQAGRYQAQDLIAGVVAVGVVEALEVIDVDYRDRIRMLQTKQRIVESAPR